MTQRLARITFALIVVALLGIMVPVAAGAAPPAGIRITVRQELNPDTPVMGATVEVFRASDHAFLNSAITGVDGVAIVSGLGAGMYHVRYSHPSYITNYYPAVRQIEAAGVVVLDAEITAFDIGVVYAPPKKASISGSVVSSDGAVAAGAVEVSVYDPAGSHTRAASFDASITNGAYEVVGLDAGTYCLRFVSPDYVSHWYEGSPTAIGATPISVLTDQALSGRDATLAAMPALKGTINGRYSQPVAGATVTLFNASHMPIDSIETTTDGAYAFNRLNESTNYYLGVVHADYIAEYYEDADDPDVATVVTLAAGPARVIDFQLGELAHVRGSLWSAMHSDPAYGARVELYDAVTHTLLDSRQLPADTGLYVGSSAHWDFTHLEPGDYHVRYCGADYIAKFEGGATDISMATTITAADGVHIDLAGQLYPVGELLDGIEASQTVEFAGWKLAAAHYGVLSDSAPTSPWFYVTPQGSGTIVLYVNWFLNDMTVEVRRPDGSLYGSYESTGVMPIRIDLDPMRTEVVDLAAEGSQWSYRLTTNMPWGSQSFAAEAFVESLDTTPPVTTISTLPAGWVSREVTFSLSATDTSGSGVEASFYRLGSSGAVTTLAPGAVATVTAENTTTVWYWSADNAGRVETSKSATVRIDRLGPQITTDATATYVGSATVGIGAQDLASGVARIEWNLDGGATSTVPGASAVVTTAVHGPHALRVRSYDNSGNEASRTIDFTVLDGSAPVTTISTVPAGWSSRDVTFTLTATDDDSGTVRSFYTTGSVVVTYSGVASISAEGVTSLQYWSVDAAGNTEPRKTVTVSIDKTLPNLITDTYSYYDYSSNITIVASDALSGLLAVQYSLDGGTWQNSTSVKTSVIGTHYLRARATDRAGNTTVVDTGFRVRTAVKIIKSQPRSSYTITRRRGVAYFTYSATVKTVGNAAVKSKTVYLEKSSNGRKWYKVATLKSNSSGKVTKRMAYKTRGTTYLRWRSPVSPDGVYLANTAAKTRLVIR